MSVNFVKYMASDHNFNVLFLSKEEGVSSTIQEKFKRLNAFHKNIYITDDLPEDLSFFDLLIIDSVNEMNMSPNDIRKIQESYLNLCKPPAKYILQRFDKDNIFVYCEENYSFQF